MNQTSQQQQQQQQPRSNNRPQWEVEKVFSDGASGVAVQVRCLPLSPPRFSISVGSFGKNGFAPFLDPNITVNNAVIGVAFNGMVTARLLDEASLYVRERAQAIQDKATLQRIEREERQVAKATGVTDTVRTGKTEREAGKRARHEQNLVARRDQDRERTQKTKGRS